MLMLHAVSAIDELQGWEEALGLNSWEETDGVRNSKWLTATSTNKAYMLFIFNC